MKTSDISTLGLPPHLEKYLRAREIHSLEQLVTLTEEDILLIRCVGRGRLQTIRDALEARGLRLSPPHDRSQLMEHERLRHYANRLEQAVLAAEALASVLHAEAGAIALDSSPVRHTLAALEAAIRMARAGSGSPLDRDARGIPMARALEEIAQAGGIPSISDPVEWQRELRQDRPLPLRES